MREPPDAGHIAALLPGQKTQARYGIWAGLS